MTILWVLGFASTFLACSSKSIQRSHPPQAPWVGKWQWKETSGGFAGQIETPSSTGKTKTLILHSDSSFIMLENDKKVASGSFHTRQGKSIYQSETSTLFIFPEEQPWFHHPLSLNIPKNYILELKEECHDCYQYQFEKISPVK